MLTTDRPAGRDQREALEAVAEQYGMPLVVPAAAAATRLSIDDLVSASPLGLEPLAHDAGGAVALAGTLAWDDKALSWTAKWGLAWGGRTYRWESTKPTFDAAFRVALGGAARIVSGHGAPPAQSSGHR